MILLLGLMILELSPPHPTQLSNGNDDIYSGDGFSITFNSITYTTGFENTS